MSEDKSEQAIIEKRDAIEHQLDVLALDLREDLERRNAARDETITRSRELIRLCSESIRAIHRRDWAQADEKLEQVRTSTDAMTAIVADFPDLYHSGYTQDALKEMVEAFLTYAIIRNHALPSAKALGVQSATYLKGMSEAATELRRFILDIMRRQERHSEEAERLLMWMEAIYDQLVTFDFPDALTHGLRRQTDVVRSVLERTRGDLTQSLRQQALQDQLTALEKKLQ